MVISHLFFSIKITINPSKFQFPDSDLYIDTLHTYNFKGPIVTFSDFKTQLHDLF